MNDIEKLERLTQRERLGELVLRFSYVKLKDLYVLMQEHKESGIPFGEFLINKNIITHSELRKMLDFQKNQDIIIDKCLENLGLMTNDKKWEILTRIEKLGEILIKNKILSLGNLYTAIQEQETTKSEQLLGDILVENNYISKDDLKNALDIQKNQALKVMNIVDELTKVTQLPIKSRIKHLNLMGVF
ncbi:MAG: hypothetical protein U0457_14225 [Candidatus Sericytochromatia bacterium]